MQHHPTRASVHIPASFALVLAASVALGGCVRRVETRIPGPPEPQPGARTPDRPASDAGRLQYTPILASPPMALPQPAREFRGVWIATVENIDWPSKPGLSTEQQKAELITLLDEAARLHLNAIVFQVRPAADAIYASPIEPWSRYLTGETGRAPEPFWDPLEFVIEEAHARGMELHAWFNPFRASTTRAQLSDPQHITRRRPDLVVPYGTRQWLDPGLAEAREYSLRVIEDVVRRYDVDAVHLDDYFYPYVEQDPRGRNIPFPDDATYAGYRATGGTMSLGDWRRDNINTFVRDMYREVHAAKPWVKVGISPFGIWRPGSPASVRGLDAYSEIYADARTWLRNGWLDYLAPQLYWLADAQYQPYNDLASGWAEQNVAGRQIFVGNASYKLNNTGWSANELVRQVEMTRALPGVSGNIFFSASSLLRNRNGLRELLSSESYQATALIPEMPWLDGGRAVIKPTASVAIDERERLITVEWQPVAQSQAYVLRTRTRGEWSVAIVPGTASAHTVAFDVAPEIITLSAVGRTGGESAPVVFRSSSAGE